MITVATVSYIHEADLIRMKLEGAGIEAYVCEEMLTSINPLYSGALGGIRIQVAEVDAEQACEILGVDELVDKGIFQCPKCSSDSVEYENISKRSAFLSLFLTGMPLTWKKRKCICKKCGHKWKDKQSSMYG